MSVGSMILGHETTASMLTWMVWELAKDDEYQGKMRDEIAAMRAKVAERGDDDFTVADLDSMPFVIAGMKVCAHVGIPEKK